MSNLPNKVIIVGNSEVGKTTLLMRFLTDKFQDDSQMTLGVTYKMMKVPTGRGGETKNVQFWDTAGQERYAEMNKMYFRGANAALIVYDITNRESFERAKYWME